MTEAELFETLFNIRPLEPGSVLQQTYAPTSVVVRSPSPQQISKSSSRGTRKLSSPSKVQTGGRGLPQLALPSPGSTSKGQKGGHGLPLLALPSSGSTSKVQTGGRGQRKRETAVYTGYGHRPTYGSYRYPHGTGTLYGTGTRTVSVSSKMKTD